MNNRESFENYYMNSTRVGTRKDVALFVQTFVAVGGGFNYFMPAKSKIPEILKIVKTRLLSAGMTAAAATRVINAFKKWYADTYPR